MKYISMILITALSYMMIPIIVILINRKWSKKKRMYFSIIFCISVSLIYQIIGYCSYDNYKINFAPAYLYGSLLLVFNSFIEEKAVTNKKQQSNENWHEHLEKNFNAEGNRSYFKDMRLEKSKNDYKNTDSTILTQHEKKKSKNKKKMLIILLIIIIILFSAVFLFLVNDNYVKKDDNIVNSNKTKRKEKSIESEAEKSSEEIKESEPCSYYPIDGTYYITISAESSAGVGDVFSKMDSNLEFRIHDSIYGDTYISKMKYQGDPTRYECDEVWYEIYLQNGKHGFVWAGYNGMYVKEQ